MANGKLKYLMPGSVLVREHRGLVHVVLVTVDGFRWNGEYYTSLTDIADVIVGSHTNGREFFGVR